MLKLRFVTCAFALALGAIGCARDKWPAPPPVDQAKYQQEYADFKKGQLETAAFALAVAAICCARDKWPAPPPVDQAKYQQEYADFKKAQLQTAAFALPLVGTWPLEEGDTRCRPARPSRARACSAGPGTT